MYGLPLNAVRALVAVYETGGIRPAARRLHVAHSSISRHLAELEKWLGVAVLERQAGARALGLTPQGEALARAGLECLTNLDAAVRATREMRPRNSVVISTTPSFAALWLLPRIHSFEEAYPWIELSVVAEQRIVELDRDGADLAIRMGRGPWPGYHCEAFMDDELVPVMSPRLWERSGRPGHPEDVASLKLIHDRDPATPWSLWVSAHCASPIDTSKGPRFASSDLTIRAAAEGLGVALVRARLATSELVSGVLMKPFGERHVRLADAYWLVCRQATLAKTAIPPVVTWLKSQATLQRIALPSAASDSSTE